MPDLWLCWYHLGSSESAVPRSQLAPLAEELGISWVRPMRDIKVNAFRAACRTTLRYTDDSGATHTVTGEQEKATDEFITYAIKRQDGFKLAEWKFFQSRRNRDGLVKGTHLTRSVVRRTMPEGEQALARQWLQVAEDTYRRIQDETPNWTLRTQVTGVLDAIATPVSGRRSFYFGYPEDYETAQKIGAFVKKVVTGEPDYTLVQVAAIPDIAPFALAADKHLVRLMQRAIGPLSRSRGPGGRPLAASKLGEYQELLSRIRLTAHTHRNRLGVELPQADQALDRFQELMQRHGHGLPSQRTQ